MEVAEEPASTLQAADDQALTTVPVAEDEAELYFLIAHALSGGPLAHIGEALATEAAAQGLLPARVDFTGTRHPVPYDCLQHRYAHLSPGALRQALQALVTYRRAESQDVSRRNISSVLDPAILPGPTALPSLPGFGARAPLWTLPPFSTKRNGLGLPRPRLAMLRETGIAACSGLGGQVYQAAPAYVDLLEHQYTIRGHSTVSYCIMFDKTGCHIITGSDDRLVKVWAVGTGLLRCTCRGHEAEISDLSVSCNNAMFASASVDSSIRVWRLHGDEPGQLGAPVSVLMGHTEMVTAVDFSPTQAHILVSTSFDGTCRVWDVRDASIEPLCLLREGPRNIIRLNLAAAIRNRTAGAVAEGARPTRHSERRQVAATGQAAQQGAASRAAAAQEDGPSQANAAQQQQQQAAAEGRRRRGASQPSGSQAGAEEEEEDEEMPDAVSPRMLSCSFSRDGRYIVAGSNDCNVYVWRWQKAASPAELGADGEGPSTSAGAATVVPNTWPVIEEPAKLEGHRNDVWLLQHSVSGEMLASGAIDGTVRVWRRPKQGRRGRGASSWHVEATLACPVDEEAAAIARRRGRQLPPPRVDQITWTCDDSHVVASMQDLRVHVFSIPDGKLHYSLKAHSEPIHVLLAHPTNPAIAISASYSGEAVVWDVLKGVALKTLDSRKTRPGPRMWPDALPIVDGFMAADGNSFALTDAAGQLHFYGLGPRCELTSRAPYDQYLSTDYEQLIRDARGHVISAVTQLPAHILTGREQLCDAMMSPYPLPFQEAYRSGRLLQVSAEDAVSLEPGRQPAYMLTAPALTAAAWRTYTTGGSDIAAQNAIARASQRLAEQEAIEDSAEAAARQAGGARRAQTHHHLATRTGATTAAAAAGNAVAEGARQPPDVVVINDSDEEDIPSSGEEYEEDEEEEGGAGPSNRRQRTRDNVRHSRRLASRRPTQQQQQQLSSQPGSARHASDAELREHQRQEREERARRRQEAQWAALEQQRCRRERTDRARNGGRLGPDHLDDFEVEAFSGDEEEEEQEYRHGGEDYDEEYSEDDIGGDESQEDQDDEEYLQGNGGAGTSTRTRRRSGREGDRHRAPKRRRVAATTREERATAPRQRPSSSAATPRAASAYSWLAGAEYHPGLYVPQVGDDVVYIRDGHAECLRATSDKRPPPWQAIPRAGRTMRAAEPCRVVDMTYGMAQDGSDATMVQVRLQLSDPESPLCGNLFVVDILPPSAGQVEFLVLRSRFDHAVPVNWSVGDQCLVYWQVGSTAGSDGAGGEWWRGTIVADQRRGGDFGIATDPLGCGGLWERFEVAWEGPIELTTGEPVRTPEAEDNIANSSNSTHSPWELFRLEVVRDHPLPPNTPQLDTTVAQRVNSAIERAATQDQWAIFHSAPDWDEAYRGMSGRREYYNRRVPLPFGLMDVATRLHLNYYRQKEALLHDVRTIADNAATFNGEQSAIAIDARGLSRYLLAIVHAAEGQEIDVEEYLAQGNAVSEDDEAEEAGHARENGAGAAAGAGPSGTRAARAAARVDNDHYSEEERDEEDEDIEIMEGGGSERHRHAPAWYEGAAAFYQNEERDRRERRPTRRRSAGTSPAPPAAPTGGRYSLRVPLRVNYRDMLQDGLEEEEERPPGSRRNPARVTPEIAAPQHHYSTRRAQAHDIAAIAAVQAAEDGGAAAEEEEEEEERADARRQRMTIRLRRN